MTKFQKFKQVILPWIVYYVFIFGALVSEQIFKSNYWYWGYLAEMPVLILLMVVIRKAFEKKVRIAVNIVVKEKLDPELEEKIKTDLQEKL